jgi:hypothetical protein
VGFANTGRLARQKLKNYRMKSYKHCFILQFEMRPLLFWDVMQLQLAINYQCFRAAYGSHLQGSRTLEGGTDGLKFKQD